MLFGRSFLQVQRAFRGIMGKKSKAVANSIPTTSQSTTTKEHSSSSMVNVDKNGKIHLRVHAKPGAATNSISGMDADGVCIKIAAPPRDGEANQEIIHYLSTLLDIKKTQISLVAGGKNRQKIFQLESTKLTCEDVISKLKNELEN